MPSILEMQGVEKAFGGNRVLIDTVFRVDAGEIVALLGANGAGKSTLMKILTGIYALDAGTIRIDGAVARLDSPMAAIASGIRLLPQELSVMRDLSVAENMLIGDLPTTGAGAFRRVDREAMNAIAARLLDSLGLEDLHPDMLVGQLSPSEQRIVEIARALAGSARILVMDEPTASLSEPERDRLFAIMRRLRAQGTGIVFISHYLDEVFAISDRIEVLRDGRNAGSFATGGASQSAVLAAMLGRSLEDLFPPLATNPGEPVFTVEGLAGGRLLRNIGLAARQRAIHGVFGLIGSGIEELGKTLFGAIRRTSGRVSFKGAPFAPASPADAILDGIGYVAAERKAEGILPDMTVKENFTLPFLGRYTSGITMSEQDERAFAGRWIRELGVRTTGPEQLLRFLSGGNQQKVCIGRWLVDGLDLLILEEPTRGVDLGARKDIYAHLRALTESGLSILVISSDAEEVAGLCDSATVLAGGLTAGHFVAPISPHELMHQASEIAAAT